MQLFSIIDFLVKRKLMRKSWSSELSINSGCRRRGECTKMLPLLLICYSLCARKLWAENYSAFLSFLSAFLETIRHWLSCTFAMWNLKMHRFEQAKNTVIDWTRGEHSCRDCQHLAQIKKLKKFLLFLNFYVSCTPEKVRNAVLRTLNNYSQQQSWNQQVPSASACV